MAYLGAGLTFPLGGGLYSPYIVNLAPGPAEIDTGITAYVRMSIRDVETHVVGNQVQVAVSYAKVFADASERFDDALVGTFLSSIYADPIDDVEADIQTVGSGIQITKTQNDPQKSVFFTSVEAGTGFKSALATAVISPNVITNDEPGAVFGLEHGPRNSGAYVFLESPSGTKKVRLAGPADGAGTRVPDVAVEFDWSADSYRYVLIWNEVTDEVELYAIDSDNATTLLNVQYVSAFQQYETGSTGSPTPLRGGAAAFTMLYGIEGPTNDRVTIGNVAVTRDVGFPLLGAIRPGNFATLRQTDEVVRYDGGDPIRASLSSWFGPDNLFLPDPDTAGTVEVMDNYEGDPVKLVKATTNKTFAIYREEPGFIGSLSDGILLDTTFYAVSETRTDYSVTGMGFLIHDLTSCFSLALLYDAEGNTLGMLEAGTGPEEADDYYRASIEIDWRVSNRVRLSIDPRRNKVELFLEGDFLTPVLEMDLNRSNFPTSSDLGLSAVPAFLAFGHPHDLATTGTFVLQRLHYSHLYQAFEGRDGILPTAADPQWLLTTDGFQDPSPLSGLHLLGGGFGPTPLGYYAFGGSGPAGTTTIEDDQLQIECDPGETQVYFRSAEVGIDQGAAIEVRVQFTDWKPKARTGTFLVIDDGMNVYMLSFVDTEIGKFVGMAISTGPDTFVESIGTEGDEAKLSFKIDWDQPHVYRMERRPLDGLYIFIDDETDPKLTILDSAYTDWPDSQFDEPMIAFGQFSKEGSTSLWDYIRTSFSRGYEVSARKVETTAELEQSVGTTQSVIVAFAEDSD